MRPGQLAAALAAMLALGAGCSDSTKRAACVYNSDCDPGLICAAGSCAPECREDRDCSPGDRCNAGRCGEAPVATATPAPSGDVMPDGGGDDGERPVGFGTITGLVHFRLYDGRVLPVAQPVVYWTLPESPPTPLDSGASCDCGYPSNAAVGGVDGRFILDNVPAGPVLLVVQKGSFRRYREIEVRADESLEAPRALTELPVKRDLAAGDEIPRIVVGTGRFDSIEDVFAKLRMGPITPRFGFDYAAYMQDPSAWGIDLMLYQQPRELEENGMMLEAPSFPALLRDDGAMRLYQLIFAPCAEYDTYGELLTSAQVRGNIQDYVASGGKLYVTDYAYDVIEQTFPGHIDFGAPEGRSGNADGHVGDREFMGIAAQGTLQYSSENRTEDAALRLWLRALDVTMDGLVQTHGNWVNLRGVGTVEACCDSAGNAVQLTPQVVMTGPNGVDPPFGNFGPSHDTWDEANMAGALFPHTLRFPHQCGEVMYSTYHTVDADDRSADIAPQELVLLYLILEISQCNPDPIKPGRF